MKKRTFERRRLLISNAFVNSFSNLFIDLDSGGKKFGAWVDQNSRNNGYDEADLIDNPAYIIESILRDILHIPTDYIDYASFDTAGNTTNGLLDGWTFCGGIYEVQNAIDILDNLLKQSKSQLYRNPDGKFSLIVYNSSASVDYINYKFDKDNNITNLKVSQSNHDDIISQVKINYALDRATGNFRKTSYIQAVKKFSGTYLNETIDGTEPAWDVDDGTVFQKENAPGACTATLAGAGAGNLDNDVYSYKVTFVTAIGETEAGTVSNEITVVDNGTDGQIDLSGIPTGNSLVTSRKIYRTEGGGSTYLLLTTLSDNTTTIYRDNIADGALGATAPTSNDTGQDYIMTDREINKVESVTGNTITLTDTAGTRDVYYNSKLITHDDNSPIFIIESSSDAGNGSTSDSTREGEAIEAIWKWDAKNLIEIDADWIIITTTATNLRDYYHDFYSVPHWIIEFDTFLRASDLKVGHIIDFDDTIMDAYMKLGGESWSGKKFRVMNISRSGIMDFHVKAIEI